MQDTDLVVVSSLLQKVHYTGDQIEQARVQEGSVEVICNHGLPCAGLRAGKVHTVQSHTDKPAKYSRQTSDKEFNIVQLMASIQGHTHSVSDL